MAIALVGNVKIAGAVNGGTSASLDTTGASLIVIHVSQYAGGTATTPTDNKGNTYTGLTAQTAGAEKRSRIFYCANPTVGTGHTFTLSNTGIYATGAVQAFSGTHSSPFDVENGATVSDSTGVNPGSVTPSENGEVIVTGYSNFATATPPASINASFTITDQDKGVGGSNYAGGAAYLIQTTAAAVNPRWTSTDLGTSQAATIATFKAAAAGGAIVGSAALVFGAGSSSLTGAGALAGTAAQAFGAGSSAVAGVGALAGSAGLLFGAGSTALIGVGALAGSSALLFGSSAALASGGDLAGTATLTFGAGTTTLTGSGALAGTSALVFGEGLSTLTSGGNLAGTAALTFSAGSTTLTGSGALAGVAALTLSAALTSALNGSTTATIYLPLRFATGRWATTGVPSALTFPQQRQALGYVEGGKVFIDGVWWRVLNYLFERGIGQIVAAVTAAQSDAAASAATVTAEAQRAQANAESLAAAVQVLQTNAIPGADQIPAPQQYVEIP